MKTAIVRTITRTQLIVVVLIVAVAGFTLIRSSYADSGSFALSPSSGSYNVGSTFNVTLQESGASATTVQAVINFSSSLHFDGDTTNSTAPFNTNLNGTDTASGNSVTINRTTLGGSGTGAVTTLTFTYTPQTAGSATVSFAASPNSYILPPGCTSAACSALTSTPSSATYTFTVPSSGGSGGGGGGGGTTTPPPSTPAPTPAPKPSTSNPKSTSVNVAPSSSSGSSSNAGGVTVPNNGSVAVNTPVSVEPSTVQPQGVTKVEYFLNGKLVDTETKPPYKYNINTTKLKNGTYKLVSKTYYDNGSVKQASQNLIVKDSALHASNLTWLYLLVIGLVVLFGLGINFIGPSALNGQFRRLFGRFGGGPSTPAPAGWPSGSISPSGGMPTPGSFASTAPLPPLPPQPTAADRLSHLPGPGSPRPGTIYRPNERS